MDEAIGGVPRRNAPRSSHGLVVDTIGRAIVSGRIPEGGPVPRDEVLEEQMSVSRTVVREAMKTLAAKGLIMARTRVGTTVCARERWNLFDSEVLAWHLEEGDQPDFLRQLTEMRLAFEPFAAGLAARRATPDIIDRLRLQVRRMSDTGDRNEFATVDLEFHRIILAAARNSFLHSVANVIDAALFVVMHKGSPVENRDRQQMIAEMHDQIVDALAAADPEAAAEHMRAVILQGQLRLQQP